MFTGDYIEYSNEQFRPIKEEVGIAQPVFIARKLDDRAVGPNKVTERIGITWQERFRNLLWMFRVNLKEDVSKFTVSDFNLKANVDSKRPSLIKVIAERKTDGLYFREI